MAPFLFPTGNRCAVLARGEPRKIYIVGGHFMKRKLLSILLTLCLAFSLLPTAALAAEGDLAEVNGTGYPALVDAINAAGTGGTVKLLANITGQTVIPAGKDIVLDLNGKTMTHTGTTLYNSGKLTVRDSSADKSGKIVSTGNVGIGVNHNSTTTIEYANIQAQEGAVITGYATGATITIKDGVFTALDNAVVAGNGNKTDEKTEGHPERVNANNITIDGGTFIGNIQSSGYIACGIYAPWKDIVTVNGGEFTVNNGIGIVARAGQVTVNGGTFTCNGSANGKVGDKNFNMAAAQCLYFDATNPAYPAYNSETDYIKVTGGTFSSDVSAYVADGYILNNGTVEKLGETNAVAKVGNTYYKTLADAVAAVPTNGTETTITLLNNVIFTGHININDGKNIILDLNGHDVVSTDAEVFDVYHSKFHVTGSGSINEAVKDGYAPIIARGSGTDTADYTVITIDKTVTLKGDYSGIFVAKDDANSYKNYGLVINMYGSIELAKDGVSGYAIYINGMNQVMDGNVTTFNLTGAQISGDAGCGIYAAGYAVWKLKDTTITGENALSLKAGNFIIDGGAYKSTGQYVNPSSDTSNGAVETGAALSLTSNDGYAHKLDVTVNGGTFESVHGNAVYEGIPLSEKEPHTPVASKSYVTLKINDGNFKSAADKAVADLTEIENKQVISGGLFSSDPSAYVADGHYVDASNNGDYPYTVKAGTKPAGALIVVKDKTDAAVNEGIKTEDKKAIHDVIGDANIDGVAEAVTPAKKADIVMKSGVTLTGSEKVEIEIAVKVEAKDADLVNGKLTFEVTPEATVKVDGTEQSKKVPVTNDMLNGKPITVKLPLPTVNGSRFTPKQILHKFTGGGYEYFINESVGGMRGAGRFKIEDNCAVFTIYGFSTFELSGTVTYVEPSYSSGSSYDPTYSVTVDKTENGSVTASPKSASKGDTVTVTVKPDSGYVLETLTVTDKNGNELTLKDKGNGKYTFTMPAGKVEVKATFMEDNSMLNFFYDVPNNAYFYEAVKWAVKNGITTGVGNDLFAPEQPCTRAQIVTFLWRAAGSPEPKGAASGMTDVVSGSYYEKAVAWAIENGITTGTTTSTFSPDATCTRAQAVTFLARALKAKAASAAEFSDVPTGSYFADAVAWAAANGVTEGIGGGLFGSDNDCTRGQIVTFLYRAYNK